MGKYSKLIVRKLKSGKNQGTLKYKDSSGKWGSPTEAAARSGGVGLAASTGVSPMSRIIGVNNLSARST